jgi:hypothetical protein
MRVDGAIQPVACGKTANAIGVSRRPAALTIACESDVVIDIPLVSWPRTTR